LNEIISIITVEIEEGVITVYSHI